MVRQVCVVVALLGAVWWRVDGPLQARQVPKVTTEARCAADLGAGAQTRRRFCDVVIGTVGADSVVMPIPPHDGPATLLMDVHNRFTIPGNDVAPGDAFERHTAVIAVIRPSGEVIERAAVVREFRTVQDLFDRLGGGGRQGGVKGVAPGPAEPVKVVIPAGLNAIGIVGIRLQLLSRDDDQTYDAPGRPVAIVSNLRIEYTPK